MYHYSSDDISVAVVDGINIRVMIGILYGVTSPVKVFSETLYAEVRLKAGQELKLPMVEELAIYVSKLKLDSEEFISLSEREKNRYDKKNMYFFCGNFNRNNCNGKYSIRDSAR